MHSCIPNPMEKTKTIPRCLPPPDVPKASNDVVSPVGRRPRRCGSVDVVVQFRSSSALPRPRLRPLAIYMEADANITFHDRATF
jgi:hypothetical protein